MFRLTVHLLLILVVLACPVQCVIGGDLCCDSDSPAATFSTAESTCHSVAPCCHHAANSTSNGNSGSESSIPLAPSDDDCHCDCLCNGAISSVSAAFEKVLTVLPLADAIAVVNAPAISRPAEASHGDPPDAVSGREIRMLRMSFQV